MLLDGLSLVATSQSNSTNEEDFARWWKFSVSLFGTKEEVLTYLREKLRLPELGK